MDDNSSCDFRAILEDEKRRIEKCLNNIQNNGLRIEVEDGNSYDADFETNHESQQALREVLNDILEAIQRIKNGTFGTCIDCQEEIPRGRLFAILQGKRCAPCQEAHEKKCGRRYY